MKLNNIWRTSILTFFLLTSLLSHAQNSWVYFTDKGGDTSDFFHAQIHQEYIDALKDMDVQMLGGSRWLNAVLIASSDIPKITEFGNIAAIEASTALHVEEEKIAADFEYGEADRQIEMLGLDIYHQMGYTGGGVRLALFDAGFYRVDSLPMFDSLRLNNQIYAGYDFVLNDTLTYNYSTHGMAVLALAGINYPDSMVGAAPGADFMLVRTEDAATEKHIEEYNWFRAMEWADSVGVDIIHSSLGYSLFDTLEGNYSYADMDGKTTIITISAELAASRGIFITNSAGNSGEQDWRYITAPCDGPNVLCIGAVDSFEQKAGFSSFGPSADGRIKPDVMAMGRRATIPNEVGALRRGSGTSLSGPLVAGLVACLMEAHPNSSNQQVFDAILQSSDRYNNPDNEYGYGIPDVLKADSLLTSWGPASVTRKRAINVRIFPNPSSETLKVSCAPSSSFEIISNQGQVVANGQLSNWMNFIKVSDLRDGAYTLRIWNDDESSNHRFIKSSN